MKNFSDNQKRISIALMSSVIVAFISCWGNYHRGWIDTTQVPILIIILTLVTFVFILKKAGMLNK